jgi:predicted N-formylglutamate amidohydrolase
LRSPASIPERLPDFHVVTCEHGGNRIPAAYVDLFHGWQACLSSHRGYDPGALVMARDIAAALQAPLVGSTVSRLLVDLNRSLSSPQAWSDATRTLSPTRKQAIVSRHYAPYRQRLMESVAQAVARGRRVIHVSSHSFTPVLDGQVRNADVGLLYDPARPGEAAVAVPLEGCVRRNIGRIARAPELSLPWEERRTDHCHAPLLRTKPICRNRD